MFTEDLSVFFDPADFALAATYDGSAAVEVIFDNEYVEAITGVAGVNPVVMGKASDFAAPVGKTLAIGTETYMIRNRRPIDDGALVLLDLKGPIVVGGILLEDGTPVLGEDGLPLELE